MKFALASMGFINENLHHNKNVIIETMIKYAKDVDIVVFGEAFLQGFYGATFEVEHDSNLAISQEDSIIKEICTVANEYAEAAGKVGGKVLYINSFCKDKNGDEIARGGSVLFIDGEIQKEIPSGKEDVLVVEV